MCPSCAAPRVVVIAGYGVADYVTDALELADQADVERERLPFPTTRQRAVDRVPTAKVYVDELAALVGWWQRRRILTG